MASHNHDNPASARAAHTLKQLKQMGHGCVASLYKHIASGDLRAIKVGKRTLVLEEDRQKFLASRPEAKIAPPAPPKKHAAA
jgi:hypothetical protein